MDDEGFEAAGLCLCQQDAYLRSLSTAVISCTPSEPPAARPSPPAGPGAEGKGPNGVRGINAGGKPSSKGSTADVKSSAATPDGAAAAEAASSYEVYLKDTPMFPESGGQPCDQGQLLASIPDGTTRAVRVVAVVWKQGAVCHVTDGPLEPGCPVEVLVNWQRRYDLMQQHTAQHVFSAVADLVLGADTASWELHPLDSEAHGSGDYGCVAVDLTLPAITAEQLFLLEARANSELRALRSVSPLVLDPRVAADLERMSALRKDPIFRGSLPPPDKIKGGKLRLIQVEGLDINACGGTHVRSTGEVQVLKVVGAERTRGHTRVRLMAGGRALAALAGCLSREAALTAKLTCPPGRHGEMVETLLRDRREGAKARKLLAAELAAHVGKALALGAADNAAVWPPLLSSSSSSTATTAAATDSDVGGDGGGSSGSGGANLNGTNSSASTVPSASGPAAGAAGRWAVLHRPSSDLDFLSLVATAALEAAPRLQVLLLTADGTDPGSTPPACKPGVVEDSTDVTFLVAGQPEVVRAVGPRVAEALGGRGGGRPGRYQGKAVGLHRLPAAKQAFWEVVSAAAEVV